MNGTVIHGDGLRVMRQMDDDSVDLILTDIPYGEVQQKSSGLRKLARGDADTPTFALTPFVRECVRVCRGSIYIFCGFQQVSPLIVLFRRHKLSVRQGVWVKTNPSPMNGTRLWLSGIENCVFARKPNATFTEHCQSPVWKYPSGRSKRHPTEKPLALFERLVLASSNPGDLVLDPCAGSGTTAVACEYHDRRYIAIELRQHNVDVIHERVSKLS